MESESITDEQVRTYMVGGKYSTCRECGDDYRHFHGEPERICPICAVKIGLVDPGPEFEINTK